MPKTTSHPTHSNLPTHRELGDAKGQGPEALAAFLPHKSDPDYVWMLTELIRMDLEQQWAKGNRIRLDAYRAFYPEIFSDDAITRSLVVEEYRLRERFGEEPSAVEYSEDYGVGSFAFRVSSLTQTPAPVSHSDTTKIRNGGQDDLTNAIAPTKYVDKVPPPSVTDVEPPPPVRYSPYPRVGETFLGFRLLSELGTGAFGKVFLAEQENLGGRKVALKVTTRATREPEQLAKLRHTNIMPIHSVHNAAPLQAVCMPFLGRSTLADMIRQYQTTGIFPRSTHALASTMAEYEMTALNRSAGSSILSAVAPNPTEQPSDIAAKLQQQKELDHIDHAIWIMTRLAEGLAHAHEHKILHLDIKPANVLFADDGHPLLLDFNLAHDLTAEKRERAGGTLPYMAPEQLEDFRDSGGDVHLDCRTDLFSMGVIFYEILTGANPYPIRGGRPDLTQMVMDRRQAVPSARAVNPLVTPDLDSIVQKLLQPDPEQRYQTTQQLLIDLQRHAQNLPLQFAPNTSPRERITKWHRRHPYAWVVAIAASLLIASVGLGYMAVENQNAIVMADAAKSFDIVKDQIQTLRVDLVSREDAKTMQNAQIKAKDLLASYGLPKDEQWDKQSKVRVLSAADQNQLRNCLGELGILMAHSEWLNRDARLMNQVDLANQALVWNRMAEQCWLPEQCPICVFEQRNDLLILGGMEQGETRLKLKVEDQTPVDHYYHALRDIESGYYREALIPLGRLTQTAPDNYAGQFALAVCHMEMYNYVHAMERFEVAKALKRTDPRPSHNRGQISLFRSDFKTAEIEFTNALKADPNYVESYRYRAKARMQTNPKGAITDLNKALELGASPILIYSARAEVHRILRDYDAMTSDLKAASNAKLDTYHDYIARGISLMHKDPQAALNDFITAADKNPLLMQAYHNQATVLAKHLNRMEDALVAQEKAVRCAPQLARARTTLAEYLARLNQREKAHEQVQIALRYATDSTTLYDAACVYAITGSEHPEDLPTAISFLHQSIRSGFRDLNFLKTDKDMDPLRKMDSFKQLVEMIKLMK